MFLLFALSEAALEVPHHRPELWGINFVEVVLGAVVAILITIWVERTKKPRLEILIANSLDVNYPAGPVHQARFLNVEVRNRRLRFWERWMLRDAALQCHASIKFCHLDGQSYFGKTMAGKWHSAPEPVPYLLSVGGQQVAFMDVGRSNITQRMDIYPGESEQLNVAGRYDDEAECYGWSMECYAPPPWHPPAWRLPQSRYLVHISVVSSGECCEGVFRLSCEGARQHFRLENKMPGDPKCV